MDESWLWEDDTNTQIDNQPKSPCNTSPECRGKEHPTGTEGATLNTIGGAGAQASELSHPEVKPTPSTGLSATGIE